MVLVSPGGLPHSITMEDVFNGRSEARNRIVAHVFKELGLIEQWGSGINRIITACVGQGLQTPKIAEQNDFFDVEIIRPRPITENYGRLAEDKPSENISITTDYDRLRPIMTDYDRLSLEEKKILLYLLDNEKISRKKAVELLNIGETKTKEIFNEMLNKKLIVREGQGRSTFYTLGKMENNK